MTDIYTKQLEEENEKLRQKLDESVLKADCYDLIMRNISSLNQHKTGKRPEYSYTTHIETQLVCVIDKTKDISSQSAKKIISDFIEGEKAAAISKKRMK